MKLSSLSLIMTLLALVFSTGTGVVMAHNDRDKHHDSCYVKTPKTSCRPPRPPPVPPISYGMILFPAFQALDVFGPLDALNLLSLQYKLNLSLIAVDMNPVSTKARAASMNPKNSSFGESIMPTHTFSTAPSDLEVLIVPGGLGTRAPDLGPALEFIKTAYPKLKYLLTVCTGSGMVARTGLLDGKKATTNKASWASTVAQGPNVKWVKRARWTVDGNIWTSSGVSAGIDMILAFIEAAYGDAAATSVANYMEYERERDPNRDPFSKIWNVTK